MNEAEIIAELLEINNPKFRKSPYSGIEIFWLENPEDEKVRFITIVNNEFCYTKNKENLPGNWIFQMDCWMLYLK